MLFCRLREWERECLCVCVCVCGHITRRHTVMKLYKMEVFPWVESIFWYRHDKFCTDYMVTICVVWLASMADSRTESCTQHLTVVALWLAQLFKRHHSFKPITVLPTHTLSSHVWYAQAFQKIAPPLKSSHSIYSNFVEKKSLWTCMWNLAPL